MNKYFGKPNRIRVWLLTYDNSYFITSIPKDMNFVDVLKQANRIVSNGCTFKGLKNLPPACKNNETDLIMEYDGIFKARKDVICCIN